MLEPKDIPKHLGVGALQHLGGLILAGVIFIVSVVVTWVVSRGSGQPEMTRFDAVVLTLGVALALMALLAAAVLIYPRAVEIWVSWFPRSSAPSEPSDKAASTGAAPVPAILGRSLTLATPIVDMTFDVGRLSAASPWLVFHCVAFNGTGYHVRLRGARGRIKLRMDEFHAQIEIGAPHPGGILDDFFKFEVKIPLSREEAETFRSATTESHVSIQFVEAAVLAQTLGQQTDFDIIFPMIPTPAD
jgi:hypothetical protein